VSSQTRHVLLETDWDWSYKRQEAIFGGMQRYAEQQGWLVTIEPFLGGATYQLVQWSWLVAPVMG
jgi:hypothetical protein